MNWLKIKYLPGVLAALGFVLILVSTARYGVGLSADSVTYIAAARNLLAGTGYYNFHGEPLLVFPPLFSTVLAVASQGWLSLPQVARYINAVCFALVIGLSTSWLINHCKSLFLVLIGSGAIIFSAALLEVYAYAWSESLFVLFTLLSVLQLEKAFSSQKYLPIFLAGIYAALASLTRYAGVALIITGLILLLLTHKVSLVDKVKRLSLFLVVAASPLALWLLRNYLISGTLTGYRVPSEEPLLTSLYLTADVITGWLLPTRFPAMVRIVPAGIIVILLTLGIIWRTKKDFKANIAGFEPILPLVLFTVSYLVFLLYSLTTTALSPVDNRYLAPIYVPLVLVSLFVIHKINQLYPRFFNRPAVQVAFGLGLALWLVYPVGSTAVLVSRYLTDGAGGFSTAGWMNSDVISYIKTHRLPGLVYTNEPYAVYALTNQVYKESPRKVEYESATPTDDLLYFEQAFQKNDRVYLVLFNGDWWQDYLYDAKFFRSNYNLEEVMTSSDGVIYSVKD